MELIAFIAEVVQVEFRVGFLMVHSTVYRISVDVATVKFLQYFEEHLIQNAPILAMLVCLYPTAENVNEGEAIAGFDHRHQILSLIHI